MRALFSDRQTRNGFGVNPYLAAKAAWFKYPAPYFA